MAYNEKIIDHYENPRNVGLLDASKTNVGTGIVGSPSCGDVLQLQIEVDTQTGKVTNAVFKTFGCGSAIASSSLVTEWIIGRHVNELDTIKNEDIAKDLSLPKIKFHCSVLAEDAIRKAVSDYKTKEFANSALI
jgi:Fe-S cluster assembly scaffold IscU